MAAIDQKLHEKIAAGLASSSVSPAVLGMLMARESLYVNESFIQYFIGYIDYMASTTLIPIHLKDLHETCKIIRDSLVELGLTGDTRYSDSVTEYLAV